MEADIGTAGAVGERGQWPHVPTVPEVHIAITGIEKVVKRFEHVLPLFSLPTRSATGQAMTIYFNAISCPRRKGGLDGPRRQHVILLDNGRGQPYRDTDFRPTL